MQVDKFSQHVLACQIGLIMWMGWWVIYNKQDQYKKPKDKTQETPKTKLNLTKPN